MMNFDITTPTPDPLIDEIRAIREELSARFDNDVEKLCDYLRTLEAEYADRIVTSEKVRSRTS